MRAWVIAALLVLPVVAATESEVGIWNPEATTPVTLWMHCTGIQDCPMNTQQPPGDYYPSYSEGIVRAGQTCFPVDEASVTHGADNTWYSVLTPGAVHYPSGDDVEEERPKYWMERGLAYDLMLDGEAGASLTWYATTYGADGQPATLIAPGVQVLVTIREGDDISVGHEAMNIGDIIAQGASAVVDLYPGATGPGLTYHDLDGVPVYQFDIALDILQAVIDKNDSFNVRIDLTTPAPACDDATNDRDLNPGIASRFSGGAFWPTLDWNILNPLQLQYVHPQFIKDDLVLHTSAMSAWGAYDVLDEGTAWGNVTLEIDGPSEAASVQRLVTPYHTAHDEHTENLEVSWIWAYTEDNAKPGLYTATFTATNGQETAVAVGKAQFEIGTGNVYGCQWQDGLSLCVSEAQGEQTTPFAPLALLLGLLAIVGRRANKA